MKGTPKLRRAFVWAIGLFVGANVLYGVKSALGIDLTPWRVDAAFPLGSYLRHILRPGMFGEK